MRETIRLYPTAPSTAFMSKSKDQSHYRLGDYLIPTSTPVMVLTAKVHRDPAVWGSDAEEFKPERMLDGKFEALPKNAWKVSTRIPRPLYTTYHFVAIRERETILHR